jgi:hypothetical protein
LDEQNKFFKLYFLTFMAIRYAVAAGNFNSVAVWDGGTSLPAAGDMIYANNRLIDVTANIDLGSSDPTVNATAMLVGHRYRILTLGTSNFMTAGATANEVGLEFTATVSVAGTGTAIQVTCFTNAAATVPVTITVGGSLIVRTHHAVIRMCFVNGAIATPSLRTQSTFTLSLYGSLRGGQATSAACLSIEGSGAITIDGNEMCTGVGFSSNSAITFLSNAVSPLTINTNFYRALNGVGTYIISAASGNTGTISITSPNSINTSALLLRTSSGGSTTVTCPTYVGSPTSSASILITTGGNFILNGDLQSGGAGIAIQIALLNSSSVTINGNLISNVAPATTTSTGLIVTLAENNSVTINGSITASRGNSSNSAATFLILGTNATVKSNVVITGSVFGCDRSGNAGDAIKIGSSNCNLTINGSVNGGSFGDATNTIIRSSSSGGNFITIDGNVTGSAVAALITFNNTGGGNNIDIKGNLTISGSNYPIMQMSVGTTIPYGPSTFRVRGTTTINIPAGGTAFNLGGASLSLVFDTAFPPFGNTYNLFTFTAGMVYTYNGDLMGSTAVNSTNYTPIIVNGSNAIITINGNLINRTSQSINQSSPTGTLIVNGNISSSGSSPAFITSSGIMTVVGNCTATAGILIFHNGTALNLNGDMTASDTFSVTNSATGTAQINVLGGSLVSSTNGRPPIQADRITYPNIDTSPVTLTVARNGLGLMNSIENGIQWTTTHALPADVRSGVVYGGGGALTGTCAVPDANSVMYGVPVSATTGTAFLSSASLESGVRSGLGIASANLDTQLSNIPGAVRTNLASH